MKKFFYLIPVLAILGTTTLLLPSLNEPSDKPSDCDYCDHKPAKQERIDGAIEYYNMMRANDQSGLVEIADYYNAVEAADELKAMSGRAALNLSWEALGPDNVGGRTRAILVDKDNPDIVWAGGVTGGLYKSTDGTATWNRVECCDDVLTTVAISSIDQAPNGDLYVGTGEPFTGSLGGTIAATYSGAPGNGIFKSTDGGNTWSHLSATSVSNPVNVNDDWAFIVRVAVNPTNSSHVMAALENGGIMESTDGGNTWAKPINISPNNNADDIEFADGNIIYAVANKDLWRSLDGGINWDNLSTGTNFFNGGIGRINVRTSPANNQYVYCGVANQSTLGCLVGIFQSTDRGDTWTNIGPPGANFEPYASTPAQSHCQGAYDNALGVSPVDANKIYVGGIHFYTWSPGTSWKDASQAGGAFSNPYYLHADIQFITFDPNDPEIMYIGSDGGVAKSVNAQSAFPLPTYEVRNQNYLTYQCYSMSATISGEIIGGAQDNGVQYIDFLGNTRESAVSVMGGDGAFTEISHINPNIFFAGNNDGTNRRSGNKGTSFGTLFDSVIDGEDNENGDTSPDGIPDCGAPFIGPMWLVESTNATCNIDDTVWYTASQNLSAGDVITVTSTEYSGATFDYTLPNALNSGETIGILDEVEAKLFVSTGCGLWVTPDPLNMGITPRWFQITGTNSTPLSLAGSPDGDIIYIGYGNGRVHKIEGLCALNYDDSVLVANQGVPPSHTNHRVISPGNSNITITQLGSFTTRPITGIDVDNNDVDHVVFTTAGYSSAGNVYKTTNGGATTPSNISGSLPPMPVYSVIIDWQNSDNYVLGTELGVYTSDDAGGTWVEENTDLGRIPVYQVKQYNLYEDGCPVIYLGTHARGMWRSTSLTPSSCNLVAGVDIPEKVVGDFTMYPNPAYNSANIQLELTESTEMTAYVIDVPGRLAKAIDLGNMSSGSHNLKLDVSDLTPGNYMVSLRAKSGFVTTKQLVIAR